MSASNIIRAWKDEEYRQSLSEAELALLPEHPAGVTELSDEQLSKANGGGSCPSTCHCKPIVLVK